MNPLELIAKKRDGEELASEEISFLINGHVAETVPDYQMSAWLMAVFLRGMSDSETTALTESMLRSGCQLEWPEELRPRADKHSTGGIGDKVSLPLAPLLACCDVCVPMLSGRGLGPTGGTLDKLESISGFRANLSLAEIKHLTTTVGCVITGTTPELVPADRKLYALRDVTATVPSIPLITASIMSKKLAEGLNALVLDVKFGNGAFMKSKESARQLALGMVRVGQCMGVATTAMLTDMNQPLGCMAGNAVEVDESLSVLRGDGPDDVRTLVLAQAADVLVAGKIIRDRDEAWTTLASHLDSGRAMERFERMISAQGGRLSEPRPIAKSHTLTLDATGFVASINTEELGWIIIDLRGGRRQLTDAIDHSVGLELLVRVGDRVEVDQPWINVFAPGDRFAMVRDRLRQVITLSDQPVEPLTLIHERIDEATCRS